MLQLIIASPARQTEGARKEFGPKNDLLYDAQTQTMRPLAFIRGMVHVAAKDRFSASVVDWHAANR